MYAAGEPMNHLHGGMHGLRVHASVHTFRRTNNLAADILHCRKADNILVVPLAGEVTL